MVNQEIEAELLELAPLLNEAEATRSALYGQLADINAYIKLLEDKNNRLYQAQAVLKGIEEIPPE